MGYSRDRPFGVADGLRVVPERDHGLRMAGGPSLATNPTSIPWARSVELKQCRALCG